MPFENIGLLQDVDFDASGNLKTKVFGAGDKPVMIMVWGSYCGHCNRAKPAFGKVFDDLKQGKVFLTSLQTDDTDPDVQKLMKRFPSILKKHGISFNGVPTYIVYHKGVYREYQGSRDEQALKSFISSL